MPLIRRALAAASLAVATVGVALPAVAEPVLPPGVDAPVGGAVAAPAATDPTVVGEGCADGTGVTVVVDFTATVDEVHVGCAPGQQANGFAALTAAGFTTTSESGPGTICTIDGRPSEGYPYCWTTGGYWSYWKPDATTEWAFSPSSASAGPLPVGRVEGWSWAPGFDGEAPRLPVADIPTPVLPDCDAVPSAPVLGIIDDDEVLPFTLDGDGEIEVAVLDPATTPLSQATFTTTDELALAGRTGPIRVLARVAGCADAPLFDANYDVRPAYAPRWSAGTPDNPSPAVDKASDAVVGWATGHSEYTPGTGVSDSFKVPENAYGPVDSSIVVLGDRGHITLTFDDPITDGPGDDLAVFENGFGLSGDLDFLEVGYVEVSSNGTDFVRFDSASRRADPVGSFSGQAATELGGLAGKDLAGKGTPFDLALLRNAPAVRAGLVDLDHVTHVRIVDVTGDGADLDSFGRPIYDAYPTNGSAGFDLAGVAVLNETLPEGATRFTGIAPTRLVDSRPASQVGPFSSAWGPGQTRRVDVTGLADVPDDAVAVALNATVTATTADSFLALWPADEDRPVVSNLNWTAGTTIANAASVRLGPDGDVLVHNHAGRADVVLDVVGYYTVDTSADGFHPLTPTRVIDSRPATQVGPRSTPWGPGETRPVVVAGDHGVPADATSVVVNATVTGTTGSSFLTLWPAGQDRPVASTLNWPAGTTIANAATVAVGTGGAIEVFNHYGRADVVLDVVGYYTAEGGSAFFPLVPERIQDSRPASRVGPYSTPWAPRQTRDVGAGDVAGVDVEAAVLNTTVTDTTGSSFLTVWPAGITRPVASSLNWVPGTTIANQVTVPVGAGGEVSAYNLAGDTHVIADLAGVFGSPAQP